ncbi:6-pyruvoyl trahydropterin synthase family protein [Thiocapsa roseopersicina]|uniref:6-carboxy-5,6,7,8-tetrahydropterin synthase n=1 Tax=Thiocapsa roseopersicina TaxID=1058 RepID=A0A1H3C7Q8_THIRO|nr:6-carboxytetrahydropterin synthase [Thiocapsa roseopersicina]SDX50131.1 6-pyruvoyltetrahydropterin/6-carboxytetrahydropterin synthase [Thiocapsa roseopersicina]
MDTDTLTRIEISKEFLNFSAGHFTIFSATERENLHGHNFRIRCNVTAPVGADGMAFDYVMLKRVLKALCDELDERLLLPELSPHLRIERGDGMVIAWFGEERLTFLERDVLLLPIRNVTIEELAELLLARLRVRPELAGRDLRAIELGVSSGDGQWALSSWRTP